VNFRYAKFSILFLLGLVACNIGDVDPEEVEFGYDYFPLDSGMYKEYQVSLTNYKTLGSEKFNYYVKEVVQAPETQFDEIMYPIYSYRREDTLSDWELDSVFSEVRTESHALRDQSNKRLLKLTFPLKVSTTWDGNVFNTGEEDEIQVFSLGESYGLSNGLEFDETVVTERDYVENFITVDTRTEVYAKNVGLILLDEEVTETQPGDSTFGFKITKTLIDYGP
jgi:hypothetical protein